jgi:hypothetical protein
MLRESQLLGTPLSRGSIGLRNRTDLKLAGIDVDEMGKIRPALVPDDNPDRIIPQSNEVAWITLMLLDLSDWFNEMVRML